MATGAIFTRVSRLEKVIPLHPLKGLSAEEQASAMLARSLGEGWASEAEHQAWIADMSEEALDMAIARLTAMIEAHPTLPREGSPTCRWNSPHCR